VAREVDDIGQLSRLDVRLEAGLGDMDRVQVELTWGDIGGDDPRSEMREFYGESPRTRSGLEHAVAVANETAEVVPMNMERHLVERSDLVSIPLLVAVSVVDRGDQRAVVRQIHGPRRYADAAEVRSGRTGWNA